MWQDYVEATHPSVVAMDTWLSTLVIFERLHQEGETEDLFEAAAAGDLWDSGDETTPIKPIYSNPDVYELRRKALKKALRFYHAEPLVLTTSLVALHRHIKTGAESQQREIDHAVKRYEDGAAVSWRRSP